MGFYFDQDRHEYWLGNEQLPSVTGILGCFSDFSKIPRHILEHKRQLGTEFHRIINLYLLDDLIESSIDGELVKPFEAFKEFSSGRLDEFKCGLIEEKLHDKSLWLAGTCDLALAHDLFDWKLRKYDAKKDILQLEGYDRMLKGGKRRRWTICFDLQGRFSVNRSEHSQAKAMFDYMLSYHHAPEQDAEKHRILTDAWAEQF